MFNFLGQVFVVNIICGIIVIVLIGMFLIGNMIESVVYVGIFDCIGEYCYEYVLSDVVSIVSYLYDVFDDDQVVYECCDQIFC